MIKLSIVVPCHNEQDGIPKLLAALEDTRKMMGSAYEWEIVFVDDGSRDRTWDLLQEARARQPEIITVRHNVNRGLGAALRTGFQHCSGDLVATVDSDCTYDPREVVKMAHLIQQGADVVVASPYHPDGAVENVPAYRVVLSKNLSRLYRVALGSNLYTYTSLFRLYRRDVVRSVSFESDGFVAMAEIIVEALLRGYRVVELPTRLSVREYGESKAAISRLIRAHLRLLANLARRRVRALLPTLKPARRTPIENLAEWNRLANAQHGMSVLEDHPNALVRMHERGRKRRILAMGSPKQTDVVVDIGCEQGTVSAALADNCRYLVCVDIDHAMLLGARERIGSGKAAFVVADAQHLPFRDCWADLTLSTHTLEHLPEPRLGLRELVRITKPEGRLIINVPNERMVLMFKRLFLVRLRLGRLFQGINMGLAPGHLWIFSLQLLKEICRGQAIVERSGFNPPFFTNLFVVARPEQGARSRQ